MRYVITYEIYVKTYFEIFLNPQLICLCRYSREITGHSAIVRRLYRSSRIGTAPSIFPPTEYRLKSCNGIQIVDCLPIVTVLPKSAEKPGKRCGEKTACMKKIYTPLLYDINAAIYSATRSGRIL